MHSEIEKFWKDAGYKIRVSRPSTIIKNSMWCIVWLADKINTVTSIAVTEAIGGPSGKTEETAEIYYRWNYKTYSEKEMIKIIKMKVFL